MPKCKKCSKSGLFLKIESDTGLCVSCNEAFARDAKELVAKVMDAKSRASVSSDPGEIASACDDVEKYGNELIALDNREMAEAIVRREGNQVFYRRRLVPELRLWGHDLVDCRCFRRNPSC